MPDSGASQTPQYIVLTIGSILLFAAVMWTYTGKAWVRLNGGWVYRAEEPKRFWLEVAIYYVVGISFIGSFFYLMN